MAMVKSQPPVHGSVKMFRASMNVVRIVATPVTSMASKLVAHPALRYRLIGYVLLALSILEIVSLSRFQLWMTVVGLLMVVLSVASAVQEFQFPKTVPSYQDFLTKGVEKCGTNMITLPHLSPLQHSITKKVQHHESKGAMSSMTLNIASTTPSSNSHVPSSLQKCKRRESEDSIGAMESAINTTIVDAPHPSNLTIEENNKLNVLHCGTVIDIQGSHGFIIPHDLGVEAPVSPKTACSDAVLKAEKLKKMPLIIPFNLSEEQTGGVHQEITVGKTVEFAFSHAAATNGSSATICARNVTPVPSNDGIVKSRFALQSCKQAREVLFARAMEELTMISPRNVPVKHHVDLIKYAENLDDPETLFD